MISNILSIGSRATFTSVVNLGVYLGTLCGVHFHLRWWLFKIPGVIHMQVSLAMETSCDRWVKEPVDGLIFNHFPAASIYSLETYSVTDRVRVQDWSSRTTAKGDIANTHILEVAVTIDILDLGLQFSLV